MKTVIPTNTFEDNRFKTMSDFKQCMRRGGEVQFEWNGVAALAVFLPRQVQRLKWCDTADEILEYIVGGDRLRDVITQVKVWECTI